MIEGLKWLCYELTTAVQSNSTAQLQEYTRDAERLVTVLTDKVAHTFTQEHISTRLCKYVLNTLMQVTGGSVFRPLLSDFERCRPNPDSYRPRVFVMRDWFGGRSEGLQGFCL